MSKTTIELTRTFIAKAIEGESKLRAGSFIHSRRGVDPIVRDGRLSSPSVGCPACAVGSVMRRALGEDPGVFALRLLCYRVMEDRDFGLGGDTPFWREARKNFVKRTYREARRDVNDAPMRTLSFLFESLSTVLPKAEVRKRVVEFVRKDFPKTVRVQINGYKPARDVKVVK